MNSAPQKIFISIPDVSNSADIEQYVIYRGLANLKAEIMKIRKF